MAMVLANQRKIEKERETVAQERRIGHPSRDEEKRAGHYSCTTLAVMQIMNCRVIAGPA